ncbi:MAG: energy transducer TonB, partial [Acidobacteriota bacterium]
MKKIALWVLAFAVWVMCSQPLFSGEAGQEAAAAWKTKEDRNYIVFGEATPTYQKILKLRVFEGLKDRGVPLTQSITSSFLKYTLSANLQSDSDLEKERDQIKKTFNLNEVELLTESSVTWKKGEWQKAHHMFRLDGKLYAIALESKDVLTQHYKIEVNEVSDPQSKNLLDTEFTIPRKNTAVFGFEDSNGKPYFISLREEAVGVVGGVVGGVQGGVEGGVEGGVKEGIVGGIAGGVAGGVQSEEVIKKSQEFEKDAVRIKDVIEKPRLLGKVDPVYPEIARKAHVEGVVIIEAKTDESGRVMDVRVLRSIPPLDQAAIDAVKQWVYEPLIIDGKPRKALFTTTVHFKLDEKDIEKFAEGAVKVKDDIEPPKLIKKVEPVYPEEARKAGIEGVVIVQARTDISGRIKDVMVLRSIPALNKAAIDAVRQWVYEPLVFDGKRREAVFT